MLQNKHFFQYKDDLNKANELGWKGDKMALQNFCINQADKFMDLWNNNDEFRKEYVRCNERSTLWRLSTLDGRALGLGEVPPVIPGAVSGRAFVNHTMSGLTSKDRTQEEVAVAKAEKEEEAAKAKEALERKRRKAEKAQAREANEMRMKPSLNHHKTSGTTNIGRKPQQRTSTEETKHATVEEGSINTNTHP
ncbi:hypothetical protein GOBAR_AA08986 [Gossypium barbadense]|uniref:Uncharacterized protein n=1 Tax=Gossypium barbadense TaxID=3634 RepID=A0A2P5Y7Z9_GOSBA|nr:hypothetical protein GOBAR_AA08986 [Gossypium barbadense]